MKLVKEGAGTMLDNTAILWGNELGKGNSHSRDKVAVCDGRQRGRVHQNETLLKIQQRLAQQPSGFSCERYGVPINTFGNPTYCTGPLRMLRG